MIPTYMVGDMAALDAALKSGVKSSWPEYEDGLVWDMLGQLGLLLKSDQRQSILPGFGKPFVYMSGVSQSSIYIRTWIAGFHDRYRTADGKPVYDGYLGIVGPAMIRMNQCAADVALDDPLQKLTPPRRALHLALIGRGDVAGARHRTSPIASRPGVESSPMKLPEPRTGAGNVPGLAPDTISFAAIPDMMKAGFKMPDTGGVEKLFPAGSVPNDFIWQPLERGALSQPPALGPKRYQTTTSARHRARRKARDPARREWERTGWGADAVHRCAGRQLYRLSVGRRHGRCDGGEEVLHRRNAESAVSRSRFLCGEVFGSDGSLARGPMDFFGRCRRQ